MQSFAAIEKAGDVTPRFGAIGRRLIKRATGLITKRANKTGGFKQQVCLAALKAFHTCSPFRSRTGRVLDACNLIVKGKQNFHRNVMSAMSAMNIFLNNNLKETYKFTASQQQYDHILNVIRILQSCNKECHREVTQTCPKMVTFNFTLLGCWLGLVWRGRNSNQLVYREDQRTILDLLLRLSFSTNAEHPFRKFRYWHGRQKTCVLGYEHYRPTRPVKLEISAKIYSTHVDGIACFRKRLATSCDYKSETPPDDVHDDDLRMMISFDSRQALAWGCDRKFSYNVGWDDDDL